MDIKEIASTFYNLYNTIAPSYIKGQVPPNLEKGDRTYLTYTLVASDTLNSTIQQIMIHTRDSNMVNILGVVDDFKRLIGKGKLINNIYITPSNPYVQFIDFDDKKVPMDEKLILINVEVRFLK